MAGQLDCVALVHHDRLGRRDKLGVPLDNGLLDGGIQVHIILTAGVGGAVVIIIV